MASCPKCNSQVPDSAFGLYTCSDCRSVLSIDFDGNVTISEDNPADPTRVISNKTATKKSEATSIKEMILGAAPRAAEPVRAEAEQIEPEQIERHQIEEAEPANEVSSPLNIEAPEFASGEPYSIHKQKNTTSTPDFAEVTSFANSAESQQGQGPYLYDVLIRGIDSEDLRLAVREALLDKRFGWDANEIVKKIRGGSIKLEKLNAVKASIFVNRIKSYPLEITWVQNGLLE